MRKMIWIFTSVLIGMTCIAAPSKQISGAHRSIASPCQSATTTLQMNQCYSTEQQQTTVQLNQRLQQIMHQLPPARQKLLMKSQQAWEQFLAANCLYEASEVSGGSLFPVISLHCQLKMTQARLSYLAKHGPNTLSGEA